MNDLEICKRIAEIEGKTGHEFMGVFVLSENYNEAVNDSHSNSYSFSPEPYAYNPLTDDALCFQIMVKYKVDFRLSHLNSKYYAEISNARDIYKDFSKTDADITEVKVLDDDPNKAILLAIIESRKP